MMTEISQQDNIDNNEPPGNDTQEMGIFEEFLLSSMYWNT